MTEGDRIAVMVVDDHAVVRNGIRFSLLAFDDMELVGEVIGQDEDGNELVTFAFAPA